MYALSGCQWAPRTLRHSSSTALRIVRSRTVLQYSVFTFTLGHDSSPRVHRFTNLGQKVLDYTEAGHNLAGSLLAGVQENGDVSDSEPEPSSD